MCDAKGLSGEKTNKKTNKTTDPVESDYIVKQEEE